MTLKTQPLTMTTESVLGDQSTLYLTKSTKRGAIMDHPQDGIIEFYPSGCSHRSTYNNQDRQLVHQRIYECAVALGREDELYPFEAIPHTIELVHDHKNEYDPCATWLVLCCNTMPLQVADRQDLGYVPADISAVIHKNKDMITGGKIYKARAGWYDKYYTCKVVLTYGDLKPEDLDDYEMSRFSDIIMEL